MIVLCAHCSGCPHKSDDPKLRTYNPACAHYMEGVCTAESANHGPSTSMEIAEATGCTRQAIEFIHDRALRRLRKRLDQNTWKSLKVCLLAAAEGYFTHHRTRGVGASIGHSEH
jgi:hypothetical protein